MTEPISATSLSGSWKGQTPQGQGPSADTKTSLKTAIWGPGWLLPVSSQVHTLSIRIRWLFPFQGRERPLVAQVSLYFSVTKWVPGRKSSFNFLERWELMSWEEKEVSCNISYKAQGSMTWWDTFLCDAGSEQGVLWTFRDLLDPCHWFIFLIMICDLLPFSHFCYFSSFPSYLFTFRGCKFLSCNCQAHIQHPCITIWN